MYIIMFSMVMVPMLYLILRDGSKKSRLKLKSKLQNEGQELGENVVLNNYILAVDKKRRNMYYMSKNQDAFEKVDLSEVQHIEVVKETGHGVAHDTQVTILEKVDVLLSLSDKRKIVWSVYNNEHGNSIGTDLIDASDFVKKVNQFLSK